MDAKFEHRARERVGIIMWAGHGDTERREAVWNPDLTRGPCHMPWKELADLLLPYATMGVLLSSCGSGGDLSFIFVCSLHF